MKDCKLCAIEGEHRHIARVSVSAEMLLAFVKQDIRVQDFIEISDFPGLPKDARIQGMGFDLPTNSVSIVFEHESFEPVFIGTVLPVIQRNVTVVKRDDLLNLNLKEAWESAKENLNLLAADNRELHSRYLRIKKENAELKQLLGRSGESNGD